MLTNSFVHLHRARLFRDRTALAAARKLIDATGYELPEPPPATDPHPVGATGRSPLPPPPPGSGRNS